MRSVAVLGASGFLGGHVTDRLLREGFHVRAIDLAQPFWTAEYETVKADIRDGERVRALLNQWKPDAVVNMAGLLGTAETLGHPQLTVEVNVIGALNVLEACRESGAIYVGIDTGTDWMNPYAITKRTAASFARCYAEVFGLPTVVLKIFNAYGPRQDGADKVNKIVPRFVMSLIHQRSLPIWGDGQQTVDLVFVDDCAKAVSQAIMLAPKKGETIEIGSGYPRTVLSIAEQVIEHFGYGDVTFHQRRIGEGTQTKVADLSACREMLQFTPSNSLHPLRETIHWYREVGQHVLSFRAL
jgi:UDP-glucose 4-epimerase